MIVQSILKTLRDLQTEPDEEVRDVRKTVDEGRQKGAELKLGSDATTFGSAGASASISSRAETQTSFRTHKKKLQQLDQTLPQLKDSVRDFFSISGNVKAIFLQIDDLYHLKRADQAFVVDYIHRLCKDVPLYFKIATLRHVSTLYVDRDGQPIGAQERHDYHQ